MGARRGAAQPPWHDWGVAAPEVRWARTDLDDRARRAALAILSPAERERHDRSVEGGRDTFLAGRMLLRTFAGELTATAPADLHLVAVCQDCGGPHGPPVIPGSELQLSLSHAPGVVVAAASWGAAVGVDVEPLGASPERLAAIRDLTGEASVLHWTRVEAVLKADGRGLRVDPARVILEGSRGWVDDSPARYAVTEVELHDGLVVCVAVAL